jgi:UDP-GlcNAc:undecaprenyl-phosphate GlcNAc-1-phosphate transferase
MQALVGCVLAMAVTMVLMPLLIRWSAVLGVDDRPEPRKVHKVAVPRVGGIAMAAGILIALAMWGDPIRPLHAVMAGIGVLLVFGVWDDRVTLPAGPKLAGQAIAAVVAMAWGGIGLSNITLVERTALPKFIAVPLTFLFLVGSTNAFNLADGLDGLAGGMAFLCLAGTGLLAYTVGNVAVGSACLVLMGALIGFLRFNTHPARVFMGDCGSQLLGFSAAVLTLLLTQDPQNQLSTALPLLLLGTPIVDTLMVMSERLAEGRSPLVADRRHIHHRLLALGFLHGEAVCILYGLQGLMLVVAWLLRYAPDLTVTIAFGGFSVTVIALLWAARRYGWVIRQVCHPDSIGTRNVPSLQIVSDRRWQRHAAAAAGICAIVALVGYAIWVLVIGAPLSPQEHWLALALAAILFAGFIIRRKFGDLRWTDKLALYPAATLLVFLTKFGATSGSGGWFERLDLALFPLLFVAMLVSLRAAGARIFRVTPLDLLVVLLVVTIPNLPDSVANSRSIGVSVVELIVLLYSIEAVSLMTSRRWAWLSAGSAGILVALSLRGFV